ncbi:MAG: NADPH-dependent assimilatory sulfite reductase hemoprotein subunit [Actinomycetota bacterium]
MSTTSSTATGAAPTGAEAIKIGSGYLAGTIADELSHGDAPFGHDAEMLLKFHGIYQQDDRDVRRERTRQGLGPDHSCMVRASVPGGAISAEQWLALDRVASLANGALRLTTRQGVQFHVVHKGELHDLVAGINSSLLTTLGACGDVVRNVMACPLPDPERRAILDPVVGDLVRRFRPRTERYWELWVDGDLAVTAELPPRPSRFGDALDLTPIDDTEPLYGDAYLPRKFKIAVGWPGDNCVDVHTNDVGVVPTLADGLHGDLTGFVVLAGGGLGMSHNRPDDTYPLLARPLAWVPPGDLGRVVEAIVATQRDHGNRDDRSRARLKYLVEERGIEWLRGQVVERTGLTLADPVELPPADVDPHHGWLAADDGSELSPHGRTFGLPVPSGTVRGGLRRALRRLVADGVVRELRVTPRQDLLLIGIAPAASETVENVLRANGVRLAADQSPTRNLAIACPALPTCSKALGEAERVLPDVVDRIEKVLADTGTTGLPLRLNMTGCPNGCSRPYAAEVGIVGRTKRNYDLFVGGSPGGDRLAQRLRADIPLTDIPDLLRILLDAYVRESSRSTSFGDWAHTRGVESLDSLLPAPAPSRRRARAERS